MHIGFQAQIRPLIGDLLQTRRHCTEPRTQCVTIQHGLPLSRVLLARPDNRIEHPLPIRPTAVISFPPNASRNAVGMQIHRCKVEKRRQRNMPVEIALQGGVSRVIVLVAQREIGDVATQVLGNLGVGIRALPDEMRTYLS